MLKQFSLVIIVLSWAVLGHAADNNSLTIKGSDTMVNLMQSWAEKFMEDNPTASVEVSGGGSEVGFSGLSSGNCDIAMSSRTINDQERQSAQMAGINPGEVTVALDGLAVIVNPGNLVSQLTLDQLKNIFIGRITNWKELGGPDAPIVLLSHEVNSGTRIYFKEHILRADDPNSSAEFSPEAMVLSSSQAVADEISRNPKAIGYCGLGYVSSQQKPIAIARDRNSPYVAVTAENVINGSYPISRALLIYTNGEPKGLVKKFVDYMLSPDGQEIVLKTGFVPAKK